ncbi:phospholipase D-like domain-containing protein [Thalassospira sp. CH_XMU1448-2]|uniref:phospholipase D-like domain-containing protein n=1 Tax=Thalassospira sp. CH_XMU1448-2 TaxID=3107773 RepID=UPI0030090C1A
MAMKVGNVEFYNGPHTLGAPDNLEDVIVEFINGATKRLEIAVQELESRPIAEAIIRARQNRVRVKLVVEQSYLRSSTIKPEPFEPGGKNEPNRVIHDAILRSNIDVKVDFNSSIFHQKFIIRDGQSVLTGSTNFTPTGTHKNLNHVVILHDKKIALTYAREFREIQQGHFGKRNEGHDAKPTYETVSGIPIKIAFAPDHNPEMEIMKQMMKARSRIDFAIFTFSKSSGIDDTMLRLIEMGMPIRGALDYSQGVNAWAPTKDLVAAGGDLYGVKKSSKLGKLHHKLMVLDDQVVIAGSFNYTGPANQLNDENIIVIGAFDPQSDAQREAQSQIALFARREIDRIIAEHGTALSDG